MSDVIVPRWIVPQWPVPSSIHALSTLRYGGASQTPFASLNLGSHVGDAPEAVAANRATLRTLAALPAEPVWLAQVHGTNVLRIDSPTAAGVAQADASVTRLPECICVVLTADCLPVLFAARDGSVIGAAHAGWRGLAAGILESTLAAMQISSSEVIAWLGPAIGPEHFEVGAEVRQAFVATDSGADGAFLPNARGRFMCNLWELARRRLRRSGVAGVYGGGDCTFADAKRFFSHRRDARSGRQATLIWRQ